MSTTDALSTESPLGEPRRVDFERWRRRSRLVRSLRIVLPSIIALIFAGLIGSVAWSTFNAQPRSARAGD